MTLSDGTGYTAQVGGSSHCQGALNKRTLFMKVGGQKEGESEGEGLP